MDTGEGGESGQTDPTWHTQTFVGERSGKGRKRAKSRMTYGRGIDFMRRGAFDNAGPVLPSLLTRLLPRGYPRTRLWTCALCSYGGALLPGEGSAMAAYVTQGKVSRVAAMPTRGVPESHRPRQEGDCFVGSSRWHGLNFPRLAPLCLPATS